MQNDETDFDKVSRFNKTSSKEDVADDNRPHLKILSLPNNRLNGLLDESIVEGIPWRELRPMLQSKEANLKAFYDGLSKEDRKLLERL